MKIAILGGGQLARMLALSAYPLGIDIVCIEPVLDCCSTKVAKVVNLPFDAFDEIKTYLNDVDCITYETENLPIESIEKIAKNFRLFPTIDALKITQDRLYEKDFLNDLTIPTVEYANVTSWDDVQKTLEKLQFPAVIKTRRSGYDGKGQYVLRNWEEAKHAWEILKNYPLIIEKFIHYDNEISIISVRDQTGRIIFYPIVLNKHEKGILRISEAPYLNKNLQDLAENYARLVLEKFNYIGVMTIEFFQVGHTLIANEIAPRVHNSGHWTIEGAETSQFENHIRAIAGLPLGSTRIKGYSRMINLIGSVPNKHALLSIPGAHFHWYDKKPMPNRKLGHVTLCMTDEEVLKNQMVKALASCD